jgi:C4-dicarboxylate transporter, DctQ subunit
MKILDHFEEWAMSLMLLAMTTLAFMQVVRRYMFSTGYPWTLEVTMICFACMIFLGISYGVRVGAHI